MIYCKCKSRGDAALTAQEDEGRVVFVVILLLWKKVGATRGERLQFYRGSWLRGCRGARTTDERPQNLGVLTCDTQLRIFSIRFATETINYYLCLVD